MSLPSESHGSYGLSPEDHESFDALVDALTRLTSSESPTVRAKARDMLDAFHVVMSSGAETPPAAGPADGVDSVDLELAALLDGRLPEAAVPSPVSGPALGSEEYAPNTFLLSFRHVEGGLFTKEALELAAEAAVKSLVALGEISIMGIYGVGTPHASVAIVLTPVDVDPTVAAMILSGWKGVRDIEGVGLVEASSSVFVSELLAADS